MPVEIREIVIKTTIQSVGNSTKNTIDEQELIEFKKRVLEECKKMISEQKKLTRNKR